ncbi:unnamed protein product [Adineta steineri]|uniref:Gamma-aminobutyric acid receptor subunit beta n=1 Tax=Adineta steineri TaxID=433720 RepID=A0A814PV53_9BILA|nr:unnamed protein product [Adineta steineri]CAF1110796.1 unnamed protein product [Adineta steineri]
MLWIHNQIFCFAQQPPPPPPSPPPTTQIEATDLEDGHPNHQLWKKMIDPGRSLSSDRTHYSRSGAAINTVEEFLDTLINSSRYDRRIRPFFDQRRACNVTMTIHINTISAINEVNMDYNTDLIFRQSWYDPRLNYSGTDWAAKSPEITLHYSLIDRIWVPDSFFRNAKEGKRSDITVPNRLIRVHRDGKVLYSQRLLLKLDCQMKLQKFPLDNQTCVVNIGSYGFATTDLAFFWDQASNISAIRVNEDLEMPDFVLSNHEAKYCNRTTATGSFACIEVHLSLQRNINLYLQQLYLPSTLIVALSFIAFWIDYKSHPARTLLSLLLIVTVTTKAEGSFTCLLVVLHLKRLFGYYLVQVYIPSMLIVILSFVSFWIDHKSVPARISVGLLTVLTVTTQSSGIRSQLPRVSYIKAIDVWMSACLVFVFAGLLEYALVNVIARKGELRQQVRFSKEVIGNRLAQVHFYKKDGGHQSNAETMETLVHKTSNAERKLSGNTTNTHVHYSSMSNTNAPSQPTPQVVVSQPAQLAIAAKPVRDSAQFVDLISAVLFPVAFIVFNIIYWMVYLNMHVEYILK